MLDVIGPILGNLLPIVAVGVLAALIAVRSKNMHFECPECGAWFKLSGLMFVLALHIGFARYVTCPVCKYRGWLRPVRDQE